MLDLKSVNPNYLWYLIGLITTDGSLSKDGRHINITSKQYQHLICIKKALGLVNKISKKSRAVNTEKIYYQLQISDVKFYRYLLSLGLISKKSLILGAISLDKKYFHDFLRGVVDGDGCISTWIHKSNRHRQWTLRIVSGAPVFIKWLKEEIETTFHVSGKLYGYKYKNKKSYIYILKFGKLASKIILNRIYYKDCLTLKRKALLQKQCLQDRNKMVNYGNILGPGAVTGSQIRLKI